MAELVAYAKANPGKLNYGSSGIGGLTHYSVELFQARTGTQMVHIPFKGGAPATAALVAGDIDLAFANMTDALPQIEAGTVRGLAVTSLGRSPYLPNLPSVHETVSPNFIAETWNGIIAPPKTPEAIINKLSEVLLSMADDPEVKEAMRKVGSGTVKVDARRFPPADQAGNGAVEAADRGDRGERSTAGPPRVRASRRPSRAASARARVARPK